jgi:hypothetical protein
MASIEEFRDEQFQDVRIRAEASEQYAEDAFFDYTCEQLMDVGDLVSADRALYIGPPGSGTRIDGYGGNPLEDDGVLTLLLTDFSQTTDVQTLTRTEMDTQFKRGEKFLTRSLDSKFRGNLEETTAAFGLSDLIAATWQKADRVRFILITNKQLSSRVDGRAAGEFEGTPIAYNVWDLSRFHRLAESGSAAEEILVDLVNEFGGPIRALPAHLEVADYEAYIAIIPGEQLSAIYDRWGARLLEQNVRVFLQARGNVNRGIRNTIENEPEMFFAYNNGITATAEHVEVRKSADGLEITEIKNLQIVNGGQTTASIHTAAKKKDSDISPVFVQMKLAIVNPDRTLEIVPKISEYANSQNRVSSADFFSNHPFHVRIEEYSRRVTAPSPDGTFTFSKWFYERARGQYQDARGNKTQAERNRFDIEYPKKQSFSKTDLAKFINVWEMKPDTVSKGAQKNFADFASNIGKEWEKRVSDFNELYYRQLISKAIVFRSVEKLVSAQPWYEGGYRANIVAYAISKLAHDMSEHKEVVDFEKIWSKQALTGGLEEALALSAKVVHDVIVNPPVGVRNVTEWAKQQACWNRVKALNVGWPESLEADLVGRSEQTDRKQTARKERKVMDGIEAQTAVINAGSGFWSDVSEWGREASLLSPRDVGVLEVAKSMSESNKIPTEPQCKVLLETLDKFQENGCPLELES